MKLPEGPTHSSSERDGLVIEQWGGGWLEWRVGEMVGVDGMGVFVWGILSPACPLHSSSLPSSQGRNEIGQQTENLPTPPVGWESQVYSPGTQEVHNRFFFLFLFFLID